MSSRSSLGFFRGCSDATIVRPTWHALPLLSPFYLYDQGLLVSPDLSNNTSVCISCTVCFGVIFKGQESLYSAILKLAGHHNPCGPGEGWGTSRQMGCSSVMGAVWEIEGQSPKATTWISVVVESQKSESSPEGHPAKRWVEDRNHSVKPKQRESKTKKCTNKELQGGKTRRWSGTGDARGDFQSYPCTGLNMLPRSFKRTMMDGQFDALLHCPSVRLRVSSLHENLSSELL